MKRTLTRVLLAAATAVLVISPVAALDVDWFGGLRLSAGDRSYLSITAAHFGSDHHEADDLARSDATDDEAIIAQTYRFGIYKLVVANWSRPPSARNNMEAKLLVELLPTGDVVSVTVLEPSGNGAFDRSAEAAVRKARRFDVPVESRLFERYFRRFTLLFRPGDLLR